MAKKTKKAADPTHDTVRIQKNEHLLTAEQKAAIGGAETACSAIVQMLEDQGFDVLEMSFKVGIPEEK